MCILKINEFVGDYRSSISIHAEIFCLLGSIISLGTQRHPFNFNDAIVYNIPSRMNKPRIVYTNLRNYLIDEDRLHYPIKRSSL